MEENEKKLPDGEEPGGGRASSEETVERTMEEIADEIREDAREMVEEARAEAKKEPPAPRRSADKWKRGGMATLMSVVFIAIVVVVNVLAGVLTDRFPSLNIDMTAQGLNTLSDQALEIARGVNQDTTIYLIGAEDSYRRDRLYANMGIEYSQVANLAERLREANSKIKVEFVDPDANPAFISSHAEDGLSSGCVLMETEKRHKTLYPDDLFSVSTNRTTGGMDVYSKVDGALAAGLELVNLETVPLLTIATGHDEMLTADSLSAFTALMEEQNFEVREIDFLVEEIPEETQILMIPTPSTDYTEEEIAKLRAFLDNDTRSEQATVLMTCHPSQGELPRLASFLEEWGLRVEEGALAESDASRMVAGYPSYVLVNAMQDEVLTAGEYPYLVSAAGSPLTLLFEANGNVATLPLWRTADTAYVVTEDMTEMPEDPETGEYVAAAIAAQYVHVGNAYPRRSVVVFGSSYVFSGSFVSATAYSDRQYLTDLLQYCTDTDASAVSYRTREVQTNARDISMTASSVNLLGLGLFTIALPLAILIAGLVIFLRRRHL